MTKSRRAKQRRPARSPRNAPLHSAPALAPFVQPRSHITRMRMSVQGTMSTTGGGNLAISIPVDPPSTTPEWSSAANLYEEFRIIGGLITITPLNQLVLSGSSRADSLVVIAYDNSLVYTPSGIIDLLGYGTRDIFHSLSTNHKPYTYGFTVPSAGGNTSIPWINTTAVYTPTSSLVLFGGALTPSTVYFEYVLDYFVEFRTRS